jgi:hypothetical protein
MGGAKALFCRNIIEACEAREHGSDSKQNHQVEGPIMQARSGREHLGGATPWSTQSQSTKARMSALEKTKPGGAWRPLGPSAQAGRPSPYLEPLALSFSR